MKSVLRLLAIITFWAMAFSQVTSSAFAFTSCAWGRPASATLSSSSKIDSGIHPFLGSTARRLSITTRLFVEKAENMYLDLAVQNDANPNKPDVVYVIMYNPGTDQEGIHTTEYPKGSGEQVVLSFESIDDCIDFAFKLREDPSVSLPEPVPTPAPLEQMEMSCLQMNLQMKVVPEQQG